MTQIEKKTAGTFIYGIGNIEVEILQVGDPKFLKEIALFVTQGAEGFTVTLMRKPELKNPIYLQRVVQHFVNHVLEGGEFQMSGAIRKHFRNWVNSQNGSLSKIYLDDGQQSNNSGNTAKGGTSSDRVEAARNW